MNFIVAKDLEFIEVFGFKVKSSRNYQTENVDVITELTGSDIQRRAKYSSSSLGQRVSSS